MKIGKRWLAAGACVLALAGALTGALSGALAQGGARPTEEQKAKAEAEAVEAEAKGAIVPRKARLKARPKAKKSAGEVDWKAVDDAVKETEAEDAAADRQVRAMQLTRAITVAERDKMRPKGLRAASPQQFQRMSAAEVKQTRVPVLAPTIPEAASMRIAARENSYTAYGELSDGAAFEVIGTRMRVVGGDEAMMKMRKASRESTMSRMEATDAPYVISRHEQGVDLSFSKFNVAYCVTVYCKDPDNDPRCAQDAFVMALAESLAVVNREEGAGL